MLCRISRVVKDLQIVKIWTILQYMKLNELGLTINLISYLVFLELLTLYLFQLIM